MSIKASKIRWRNIPQGWRFTCATAGCETLTTQYCKNATCREPHCDDHKSRHMIATHTEPKLRKRAGIADPDVPTEVLALVAKLRRQPGVSEIGTFREADGAFVAWASGFGAQRHETRATRLEVALQELFLELEKHRPARPQRRPSRV